MSPKHIPAVAAAAALMGACAHAPPAAGPAGDDPLAAMVAAELGFAEMAARTSVRDAFLANMEDDAIVFPGGAPAGARELFSARPANRTVLTWYPSHAHVSASGEMGFTTGPAEVRPENGPLGYSTFVTVWRRGPRGWKWMVDLGASAPTPPDPVPARLTPASVRSTPRPIADADPAGARESLLAADRDFGRRAESEGLAAAFAAAAADDVRLNRDGSWPVVGRQAVVAALPAGARQPSAPTEAHVSRAGDFGWSHGTYRLVRASGEEAESGSYLRVWTREGGRGPWRLALDITAPRPKPREE